MKKSLNQILIAIGFIIAAVGAILQPLLHSPATSLYIEALIAVLAVCFIYAKNDILKNVGYGLCLVCASIGLVYMSSASTGQMLFAIGSLVMALGAFLYLIILILKFFGFVKSKDNNYTKTFDVLEALNNYKNLADEKVLSDEEFNELKANILASSNCKAKTIDDLKKWKKAVEQKIITEEEYNSIKADIFSK